MKIQLLFKKTIWLFASTSLVIFSVIGPNILDNTKIAQAEETCPATVPWTHSVIRTGSASGPIVGEYDNQGWNMDSNDDSPTNVTINITSGTVLYFTNTTSGGSGPNRSLGGVHYYSGPATIDPPSWRAGYYPSNYYFIRTTSTTGHTDAITTDSYMQVAYYQSCWGGFDDGVSQVNISIRVTGGPSGGSTLSASATANLTIYDTPDLSLQVNGSSSATISAGSTATLSWTPVNTISGTSCTATGDWTGAKSSTPGTTYTETTAALSAGTYTYNLVCSGGANSTTSTKTVTLTVTANAPTASITANGTSGSITIAYNDSATIAWTSANATSCTVTPPNWTGTSGSQSTGVLTTTTTYTETCTGPGGTASSSVIVNVTAQPDFSFSSCSPATQTISKGDSTSFAMTTSGSNGFNSTISYTTSFNPSSGTLPSVSYTNNDSAVGSTVVGTLTTDAVTTAGTYTVTFTGTGGGQTHTCSVTLVLNATAPTANITANGTTGSITIPYNSSATIAWTSGNADSCSISPSGWTGTSGSQSTGNLTSTTTYTETCTGPGGTTSDSVTVNVTANPPNPPSGVTASNAVTCGTVAVIWQPDSGHDTQVRYDVYKATSSSGPWSLLTSTSYVDGQGSYTAMDTTPSSGSNYYYVVAVKNSVSSTNAYTTPVSPQTCAVNVDFSNKDLIRVNNNTASAGADVDNRCNGQSDIFTLPNQAIFKDGDKVYFRINVCNNGTQVLTNVRVTESASISGLTNIAYESSYTSPGGCVTGADDAAKVYTLADIPAAVNGNASICSFVLSATISSGGGPAGQLFRFQNIATISSAQTTKTVSTPRYLFGVGSGVPTRNETAP